MTRIMTGKSDPCRDQEARTEVVKLKQEMADIRQAVERMDEALRGLIEGRGGQYISKLVPIDDGGSHAEDGWPWDVTVPGCICEEEEERYRRGSRTLAMWCCPVHRTVLWQLMPE